MEPKSENPYGDRTALVNKAIRITTTRILSKESFTADEAVQLAGTYYSYLSDTSIITNDELRRKGFNVAAPGAEGVLGPAQHGDFVPLKAQLKRDGEIWINDAKRNPSHPAIVKETQENAALGRKFLQMVEVIPDQGNRFVPIKPAW